MLTALELIDIYISFFEKRGHKRIPNAPLVPENDPTTLFTSSGMQPLVPYLLGEAHPQGKRLVNVQNCFRAQDIDEVGDNRHTTFFRMLGNWSLGDYFKNEQLPWFFEFLTNELKIDPKRLSVTVFSGYEEIGKDEESANIWKKLFESVGLDPKERIFYYDPEKNWWSRTGVPKNMPEGEPGGPDSEVFYEFTEVEHNPKFGEKCHPNCDCGRFLEIGNSVFMEYKKENGKFVKLPQKNVDFGGGLERILAVLEEKQDIFQTSLFSPIIKAIEGLSGRNYQDHEREMRIITDHLIAASFIIVNNIQPSNKEQGYLLRRLIRRANDNLSALKISNALPIIETIIEQYEKTDPILKNNFEKIENIIIEEKETYRITQFQAKKYIERDLLKRGVKIGDELYGKVKIPADLAFKAGSSYGLSPMQLESLGYTFDLKLLVEEIKKHREISRRGAERKFAGGLADQSEQTVKGHTATHLLHKALKDVLGEKVHQTGSNITAERIRFDFNYDKKISDEEIKKIENIVNKKIEENLPVHFEIMEVSKAQEIGAIGLFGEKYQEKVKVYFIGDYSVEICGGPHVDFTGRLKKFKIIKRENKGLGKVRIYAVLEN